MKSLDNLEVGDSVWDRGGEKWEITQKIIIYAIKNRNNGHFDGVEPEHLFHKGFTTSPPDKMVSLNAVLAKLKELGK